MEAWGTEHRIGARCYGVDGGYPTNDSSIFPRIYTTICQCSEFSVGDRPKIAIYGVAGHPLLYAVAAPQPSSSCLDVVKRSYQMYLAYFGGIWELGQCYKNIHFICARCRKLVLSTVRAPHARKHIS